jgi:hypothetical protein
VHLESFNLELFQLPPHDYASGSKRPKSRIRFFSLHQTGGMRMRIYLGCLALSLLLAGCFPLRPDCVPTQGAAPTRPAIAACKAPADTTPGVASVTIDQNKTIVVYPDPVHSKKLGFGPYTIRVMAWTIVTSPYVFPNEQAVQVFSDAQKQNPVTTLCNLSDGGVTLTCNYWAWSSTSLPYTITVTPPGGPSLPPKDPTILND